MRLPNVCRLIAALMLITTPIHAEQDAIYTVSIRNLEVRAGERVEQFLIEVTAGAFEAMSPIPVGWYFQFDNDASWNTYVKGQVTVGAAALSADQLKQLRFRVRKNEGGGVTFAVSGTVALTTDFETTRELSLRMSDFSVTPVK